MESAKTITLKTYAPVMDRGTEEWRRNKRKNPIINTTTQQACLLLHQLSTESKYLINLKKSQTETADILD
jgi:hypothetical protein